MKAAFLLLLSSLCVISSVLGAAEWTPKATIGSMIKLARTLDQASEADEAADVADARGSPGSLLNQLPELFARPSVLAGGNPFFLSQLFPTRNLNQNSIQDRSGKPNIHHDPTTEAVDPQHANTEHPLKTIFNLFNQRLSSANLPAFFQTDGNRLVPGLDHSSEVNAPSLSITKRDDDDDDFDDNVDDDYDDYDDDGDDYDDYDDDNDDNEDDDFPFDDDFMKKLFNDDDGYDDDAADDDYYYNDDAADDDDLSGMQRGNKDGDTDDNDDAVTSIMLNHMASMQSLFNFFLFNPNTQGADNNIASNLNRNSEINTRTTPCLRGSSVHIFVFSSPPVSALGAATGVAAQPDNNQVVTPAVVTSPAESHSAGKAIIDDALGRYDKYLALATGALIAAAIVVCLHRYSQSDTKGVAQTEPDNSKQHKNSAASPVINKLFTIEHVAIQPVE